MTYANATNCNPNPALGSILKASPAQPAEKIRGAALLIFGETLDAFARRLGRTRNHLSQVINGATRDSARLRGDITRALGVADDDIWSSESESSTSLPQAQPHVRENTRPEVTHAG